MKKEIVIFHSHIPKVGGIESAVYNLAHELDKEGYKVTILFKGAEGYKNLFKYAEVGDVVKLTADTKINTNTCLIASNHDIPPQITAKKFYQWVHSDYDKYKLDLKNKGKVEYIAVSKHCAKVIEKREKIKSKVIYNLIPDEFGTDKKPLLKLVTNSRVSPEKGFGRMLTLAQMLVEKGVNFKWDIYGDNTFKPNEYKDWIIRFRDIEQVSFLGFKSDITVGLRDADYLCQLSDFEGCPYSVLEALKMGVPCIVSNWLGVRELIKEGENGYILDMDMKKVDLDKIVNSIPKFEYKPLSTVNDWIKLLEDSDVKN